jgi:hypothetical protein
LSKNDFSTMQISYLLTLTVGQHFPKMLFGNTTGNHPFVACNQNPRAQPIVGSSLAVRVAHAS